MAYFLVRSTEDGMRIVPLSEAELLKRITPDTDGETYYGSNLEFLTAVPDSDKGCWNMDGNPCIIIKGEIIIPKIVQVATKIELP